MKFIRSFLAFVALQLASFVAGISLYQDITLPGTDITFAYLDSGPPLFNEQYTTWVILHGMGFNSVVFDKILLLGLLEGVRIVAVNRRDYAPTSPLDADELAVLSDGDAGAATYFQQRGNEIGLFIDQWLQQNSIPTANEDGSGGLVLIGWSLGTVTAHAFLAHLDTLPSATLTRMSSYLHTVLQHDPFATSVGYPNPPEFDISLWFITDPEERFEAFQEWVTAYYQSVDVDPSTGNEETLDYNDANPSKQHTFSDTPQALLNLMLDETGFAGSDTNVLFFSQAAYIELVRRALFDTTIASYLPNVKVRYFYGAETPGMLILACWEVTSASPSYYGGVTARNIGLHHADEGNHFIFYDHPIITIQQYSAAIST